MKHIELNVHVAGPVETDAAIVFPYPNGFYFATQFLRYGESFGSEALQANWPQAADTFTTSYSDTACTVTYKGATTIPSGTKVSVTLPVVPIFFALPSGYLNDATGGVELEATGPLPETYDKAAVSNQFAAVISKINKLVDELKALRCLLSEADTLSSIEPR